MVRQAVSDLTAGARDALGRSFNPGDSPRSCNGSFANAWSAETPLLQVPTGTPDHWGVEGREAGLRLETGQHGDSGGGMQK